MAESRRKHRAGHDRPLEDPVEDVGAGVAPAADETAGDGAVALPHSDRPSSDAAARESSPDELRERVADLERRLAEAEAARDERMADLQRVAADFDNFRKRAARDQENLVARAHERLMKALLPVVDDLERALVAAAEHEEMKLEEGVRLVARELREALRREGLAEIETDGAFDPHVHEALLAQPSEQEEGTIIEVLQKGYRLGDRVLRPARVVISQGVAREAESD